MKLKLALIIGLLAATLLHAANGTGTTNTLAMWVGPNTLGDSSIKDDGTTISTPRSLFEFGPRDVEAGVMIFASVNTNGNGSNLALFGGGTTVDGGNGGSVVITAEQGQGETGRGGNVILRSGNGEGGAGSVIADAGTVLIQSRVGNVILDSRGDNTGLQLASTGENGFVEVEATEFRPASTIDLGTENHPWRSLFLAGTENQITFGDEASAPDDPVLPVKWIAVQVAGDTNSYRLPLYK